MEPGGRSGSNRRRNRRVRLLRQSRIHLGPGHRWPAEAESNSTDVVVIDALEGISEDRFLSFSDDGHEGDDGSHDDEDDHSHGDDHEGEHDDGDDHESEHDNDDNESEHDDDSESLSVDEFELLTSSGDVTATWHDDHWDGGVPPVPADGSIELEAAVQVDGEDLALGANESHQLGARVADDGSTDVLEIESHGDAVEIRGRESGQTRVIFELRRDDERVWDSSADPLRVEVAADAGSGMTAFHDPHVWLDPVLAADVVHTIADGLGEVAPDDADTFEANAEAYAERLAEVDEQFRALVDEADLEVAVLAGHDSFRYLERRYGFELHSPVGVSPTNRRARAKSPRRSNSSTNAPSTRSSTIRSRFPRATYRRSPRPSSRTARRLRRRH
ncbi:metal ABC transporter substrate-binding protein [Saliphagus sp. GCM10025308]